MLERVPLSRICTMREYADPELQPYLVAMQALRPGREPWPSTDGVWASEREVGYGLRLRRQMAEHRRPVAIKEGRWAPTTFRPSRKLWEWGVIGRTLDELGMTKPGRRGLGFAVGTEPLTAYLAGHGVEVVATDLGLDAEDFDEGWLASDEHAASIDALRFPMLCPDDELDRLVSFRPVDMRQIPSDLRDFDFCWSSCSLEHLGSLQRGIDFVHASLKTLKPGGYAVHTTEANISSNTETAETGNSVIYRRRDFEALAEELRSAGHEVELSWDPGREPEDLDVDVPPYEHLVHLKLELLGFVSTSYLLVVRKGGANA